MPSATAPTMKMVEQCLAECELAADVELQRKAGQRFIFGDQCASCLRRDRREEIGDWVADCSGDGPGLPPEQTRKITAIASYTSAVLQPTTQEANAGVKNNLDAQGRGNNKKPYRKTARYQSFLRECREPGS